MTTEDGSNFRLDTGRRNVRKHPQKYSVRGDWFYFEDTTDDYEPVVRIVDPSTLKIVTTIRTADAAKSWMSENLDYTTYVLRDGRSLIAAYEDTLWLFDIPTGKQRRLWRDPKANAGLRKFVVDEVSGNLLLAISHQGLVGADETVLFNLRSSRMLWRESRATDVCAVSSRSVSVIANRQLSVLDVQSRKQLTYDEDWSSCEIDSVNGLWYYDAEGVYRIAA